MSKCCEYSQTAQLWLRATEWEYLKTFWKTWFFLTNFVQHIFGWILSDTKRYLLHSVQMAGWSIQRLPVWVVPHKPAVWVPQKSKKKKSRAWVVEEEIWGWRKQERWGVRELYFLLSVNRQQHICVEHSILWAGRACPRASEGATVQPLRSPHVHSHPNLFAYMPLQL